MAKQDIGELPGQLYQLLKDLQPEERQRVISATLMLFGQALTAPSLLAGSRHTMSGLQDGQTKQVDPNGRFSNREEMSPKQFLLLKEPRTDVERATCLAYYLAHYRDMPQFRTIDISKLNTEAAQIKFSNPALAIRDAVRRKLLAPGAQKHKQVSAIGELFVDALPNRDEARLVLEKINQRKARITKKRTKAIGRGR